MKCIFIIFWIGKLDVLTTDNVDERMLFLSCQIYEAVMSIISVDCISQTIVIWKISK